MLIYGIKPLFLSVYFPFTQRLFAQFCNLAQSLLRITRNSGQTRPRCHAGPTCTAAVAVDRSADVASAEAGRAGPGRPLPEMRGSSSLNVAAVTSS
jgi:hypothetical protein